MKKLLASDYDGTFITSDGKVSCEQLEKVNEFIAHGNIFAIITGRMTESILPLVKKLNLKGLVASYNGGEVCDIESGKRLYTNYINSSTAVEIFKVLESENAYFHGYYGENYFCKEHTRHTDWYENITFVKATVLGKNLSEYFEENNLPTKKIMVLDEPEVLDRVFPKLLPYSKKLNIIRSNPLQIEITDLTSTKANALDYLVKFYGIDKTATFAVGDGGNDASMIKWAETGVAVANAEQSLKEVADLVLDYTNDQNAVMELIKIIENE